MKPFPIDAVRGQFPSLTQTHNGHQKIYIDNPAGTQIPERVFSAVRDAMINASSNLGGLFENSRLADTIWEQAHDAMAVFLNAESRQEIIIGPAMTALTFHTSRSIGKDFQAGDELIVTRMDHEGDVSPWLHLAEDKQMKVKWLSFNADSWQIEAEDLEALLSSRTKLVALNFASNLTGSINQIKKLTEIAHAAGALVYVDAVQLAPHNLIDVQDLGCDFLACSSYKFYGPHLGILWAKKALLEELSAYKVRCASDALPEKFELGTPQTELLAGLSAAVGYFEWLGESVAEPNSRRDKIVAAYKAAQHYENQLTAQLIEGVKAISGTRILGITDNDRIADRVPTVSFVHHTKAPIEIVTALDDQGICAWSGHNYALEVVRQLGIDENVGVTRLGIGHYNTEQEVHRMLDVLQAYLA
jgi:cysteine desulfurase family protein (TIGR01976 family)